MISVFKVEDPANETLNRDTYHYIGAISVEGQGPSSRALLILRT